MTLLPMYKSHSKFTIALFILHHYYHNGSKKTKSRTEYMYQSWRSNLFHFVSCSTSHWFNLFMPKSMSLVHVTSGTSIINVHKYKVYRTNYILKVPTIFSWSNFWRTKKHKTTYFSQPLKVSDIIQNLYVQE